MAATLITNSWLVFSVTLIFLLFLAFYTYNGNDIALLLPTMINFLPLQDDLKTLDSAAAPNAVQEHIPPLMPTLSPRAATATIAITKPSDEVANHVKVCLFLLSLSLCSFMLFKNMTISDFFNFQ